jgi:hypothetical protein
MPTGTMTFFDGSLPVATVPVGADGSASLTSNSWATGIHLFTAAYAGNTNFFGSTSAVTHETVKSLAASTIMALLVTPDPWELGGPIPLQISAVVAGAPITGKPSGTVTFFADGALVGTGVISATGTAVCLTAGALSCKLDSTGTHSVTAMYGGDATFGGSAALPTTVTVYAVGSPRPAPTVIVLTSAVNPSNGGDPVTLNAVVRGQVATVPAGHVDFFVDGARVSTRPWTASSTSLSLSVPSLMTTGVLGAIPPHIILAEFVSDSPGIQSSTSIPILQFVR